VKRRSPLAGVLVAVLLAVLAGQLIWSQTHSSSDPARQAALRYATHVMVWSSGPSVTESRLIRFRDLQAALKTVTPRLRADVNVPDLLSQYGPNRKVEMVILSGTYDSLPPGEGVELHGEVLVLINPKTNHPLYLMD
jgi:hypothetical protein